MVNELLQAGIENAINSTVLCKRLQVDRRTLVAIVARERQEGFPICASTGGEKHKSGYYLAGTRKELKNYCDSLRRRAGEIFRAYRELMKAMEGLPEDPEEENGSQ